MTLAVRFSLPGQEAVTVSLYQSPMVVGNLLSNHIVLQDASVEPIHALFEEHEGERWTITDLGSENGVKVNGKKIEVESTIKVGDVVSIGNVALAITIPEPGQAEEYLPTPPAAVSGDKKAKVAPAPGSAAAAHAGKEEAMAKAKGRSSATPADKPSRGGHSAVKEMLFSPKEAKPSGDVLEVVAYWGSTILEVEHFHPSYEGFTKVTVGDPTKCHFIAAGPDQFSHHTLASVKDDGYRLQLHNNMAARLRRGGKVEQVDGGNHSLNRRDIADVKYGAVRYFFLFVRPPALDLPKTGPRDPFFMGIIALAMSVFVLSTVTLWSLDPVDKDKVEDDIWSIVHVPEKVKKIKKEKQDLAEVKEAPTPRKTPPPPVPKPVEPVKIEEKEKPKPPEPVAQPQKAKMTENLAKAEAPKPVPPAPKPVPADKAPAGQVGAANAPPKPAASNNNQAGPPKTGGPAGGGNTQAGGVRQGNQQNNIKGVEGVNNNKASGVNLKSLGLGVGKISTAQSPSAIYTNFRSSAGGAGGGSGSGAKTLGLGGLNAGGVQSLGLGGSGSASNNFGAGSGGILNGQGGGGAGLGQAFGGGRRPAQVNVIAGDPVASGGLSSQEILGAIRANLNQIRNCYEKLLQRSPNATGKIAVSFVIGLNGRVTNANITNSSISDGAMQGCVRSAVVRWPFPKPRGGAPVTVNYPFTFNPL